MFNDSPVAGSIWDARLAPLTIGSLLALSLVAFEGLAMATLAPVVADDIGGVHLYGWMFSAFLLTQIVGTVVGGQEIDRRSPAVVFATALVIFTVACLLAGFAPNIYLFLIGRALQGAAAGVILSTIYSIINMLFEDRLRPAVLATVSAAYVLPSLIGPAIAGFLAETFNWRVVFIGLLPLIVIVAILVLPRYRAIAKVVDPAPRDTARSIQSLLLAASCGVFLGGLEIDVLWLAIPVVGAALGGIGVALYRLLPKGTFTARPVLPAANVTRSMVFSGFIVIETYMVFALKSFGGVTTTVAGLMVSAGSLTWTGGSWLQARWELHRGESSRSNRILAGVAFMLVGIGWIFGMIAILDDIWLVPASIGWLLAGTGIGLAFTTASTVSLSQSPAGSEGLVSSSMLLGDLVTASIGVGIGGVLLALGARVGWSDPASVSVAMLPGLVFLTLALGAGSRLKRHRYHTQSSPKGIKQQNTC
jgi:MFS family permease